MTWRWVALPALVSQPAVPLAGLPPAAASALAPFPLHHTCPPTPPPPTFRQGILVASLFFNAAGLLAVGHGFDRGMNAVHANAALVVTGVGMGEWLAAGAGYPAGCDCLAPCGSGVGLPAGRWWGAHVACQRQRSPTTRPLTSHDDMCAHPGYRPPLPSLSLPGFGVYYGVWKSTAAAWICICLLQLVVGAGMAAVGELPPLMPPPLPPLAQGARCLPSCAGLAGLWGWAGRRARAALSCSAGLTAARPCPPPPVCLQRCP